MEVEERRRQPREDNERRKNGELEENKRQKPISVTKRGGRRNGQLRGERNQN